MYIWERLEKLSSAEMDWLMREYSSEPALMKEFLLRFQDGGLENGARKLKKLEKMLQRYEEMRLFDRRHLGKKKLIIAGVDEAGRGPLAGPVVAACVAVGENFKLIGIDDSKKLSQEEREHFYHGLIRSKEITFGIGIVSSKVIDRKNILEATRLAVMKAVNAMSRKPDLLLTDALEIPDLDIPQEAYVKGDSLSYSIAAASIIAKVTRDRILDSYHQKYPEYGFARNKGYGTSEHLEALEKYGPCPIHRLSFRPVREVCSFRW